MAPIIFFSKHLSDYVSDRKAQPNFLSEACNDVLSALQTSAGNATSLACKAVPEASQRQNYRFVTNT